MKKLLYLLLLSAGLSQAQIPQLAPLTVGGLKIRGGYRLNDSSIVVVAYDSAKQHITTTKRINLCSDTTKASYLGDIYRDGDTLIFTPSTGPYNRLYMVGATQGQILAFDTLCECWKPTDISSITPSVTVDTIVNQPGTGLAIYKNKTDSTFHIKRVKLTGSLSGIDALDSLVLHSPLLKDSNATDFIASISGTTPVHDSIRLAVTGGGGTASMSGHLITLNIPTVSSGLSGWKVTSGTLRTDTLIVKADNRFVLLSSSGDTLKVGVDSVALNKPVLGHYQAWLNLDAGSNISSVTVMENTTGLNVTWSKVATGTYETLSGTFNPLFTYGFTTETWFLAQSGGSYVVAIGGFAGSPSYSFRVTVNKVSDQSLLDVGAFNIPADFYYLKH